MKTPRILDLIVERGVLALLVFSPLVVGSMFPWSDALLEIAVFSLFALQLGRGELRPPRDRPARVVLALFALFVALALFQAAGGSIYPQATRDELLRLLACAAFFLVVSGHFRTRERVSALARTILYTGAFIAVFAVVQKLTWNGRLFWFYPLEERLRSGIGIWGPFINRNHFAGYLAMAVPLGLGLMLHAAPDTGDRGGDPLARRAGRFLSSPDFPRFVGYLILVLLMSAGVFMSLSRGGVAAFVGSGLLFLALVRSRRRTRRKALPLAFAAAALAAVVMVPSWERIAARYDLVVKGQDFVRFDLWQDCLGILRDHPLLGTGLGTFEQAYARYQTKYARLLFDHAHNDYLELATDTGAVGALLGVGMAAFFLVPLVRRWYEKRGRFGTCVGAGGICSLAAIAVHSGSDFNLHITANALLLTAIGALTRGVLFSSQSRADRVAAPPAVCEPEQPLPGSPRRPGGALFTVLVAVLAGLLLCLLPIRRLIAVRLAGGVERLLDDPATAALDVKRISAQSLPSYREAIGALERAVALEPLRSAWPRALADLHGRLGIWARSMSELGAPLPAGALSGERELADAILQARRAVALEPTNAGHHFALGRLYTLAAPNDPRAVEQLRAAVAAAPGNAPLREMVALQHLRAGRRREALAEAAALIALDAGPLPATLQLLVSDGGKP